MAKTRRQIIEDLKLIDVVIELLDARIPVSSRNPDILAITKGKKRIILLNKSDLSDDIQNNKWLQHYKNEGIPTILVDSNSGNGINQVLREINKVMEEDIKIATEKGRIGKNIRVIVLGIPNVGKSSFINRISKKTSATVGNKPGVTKQKQWIRIANNIELLDTPGVLWPKFQSESVGLNLAYTGSIKDELLEKTEIAYQLLRYLYKNYKNKLLERYKILDFTEEYEEEERETILRLMETIGEKRGAKISGGRIDLEKVSNIVLDDFRSGKIGKITLEQGG